MRAHPGKLTLQTTGTIHMTILLAARNVARPTTCLVLAGCFLMSACASSGGGGGGAGGSSASLAQMEREASRLTERAYELDATPTADMPTTGTATYNGLFVALEEYSPRDWDIVGRVNLTADFDNNEIGGSVSDVRRYDGVNYASAVRVENGVIVGNDFAADVAGDLDAQGSTTNLDGRIYGEFQGANAEMLVANGQVDAVTDGVIYEQYEFGIIAEQ